VGKSFAECNEMKSKEVAVAFGIPQGSVLEPMLQYFLASDIIMETILQILYIDG
jgi:hypothetical protein